YGAGSERDLAGDHRQQVGDDQRHHEDEEVLPHQPSSANVTPCDSRVAARSSRDRAPARRIRGWSPVASTMVDALPPAEGPPSTTTLTTGPSIASAVSASCAAGWRVRLAELTARGPVRSSTASASSWSGIRTATVP